MRGKSVVIIALAALLIAGCSVRLPVTQATAEPLSNAEVSRLSDRPSVPGDWYDVKAVLPRASVGKIARWELYTHIIVEDCRTGDTVGVVPSAQVEGMDGDFRRLRRLLQSAGNRSEFVLSGAAFFPANKPRGNLCLRLEGGSYTLQKITSDGVALRLPHNRS